MDKDKLIGTRLDGRYELTDLVGEGGMANVYRASDVLDNRVVAVKILKNEYSESEEFQRRFRDESKAIAMMSHPNIVKIYDMGFSDKMQYIVMEYIDGITLKDYIDSEHVLNWKDAVHFVVQILRALQHAHNRGIVHRDIKPQNIMLLTDGTIKVMDFGIAKFAREESRTATDQAIGTVHYISPEQARGDVTDAKSDLYSVGVMFYEMLTGKLPFVADNAVSVALMQLQAKPVMPRELNPSIPRGLEQITMRAMEKNPVDRFQSAGEMLDDLDEFRRNPNIVFHYDLQTANARYDASRSMEAYDASRQAPAYNDDYEYEEELVRSRRSAKGAMVVKGVLAAAIIVGLAVAVIYFLNYWNNRPEAGDDLLEMPNLVGQLYEDVIANEEYADFNIQVREGNDPDLQPGEIMNQDPAAGIMVKKDADVELLVNGGVGQVEVPDVVTDHMTLEEAQQAIEDAGLHSQVENVADDEVEEGRVISTNPEPGTMVDSGSTVTLRVSTGPAEEMVTVPDGLVGDTLANVSAKLEEAGLVVGNVNRDDTSTLTVDTVISLSPNEGSEISKGSTVDITVSSGKGATKTLSTSIPLPSSVSEDITLEVYRNGTKVTTDTVNPAYGSSYSLSFTGTSGSETVVVTLNSQTYMELQFDFDTQSVQVTRTYEFIPSGGGDSESSSSSESSESSSESSSEEGSSSSEEGDAQ